MSKKKKEEKEPRGKPVNIPTDFDTAMEGLLKVPPPEKEKKKGKKEGDKKEENEKP